MAELELRQIAQWLDQDIALSKIICGFKSDSRAVMPGDLFFALTGEKVDGHAYLKEVAASGAIAAVVSKKYAGEGFGLTLLRVDSVLIALQKLAKIVHSLRKVRVIGVTGSVGKTTTKEFIATLLEGKFRVAKTPGNANSQVGVPLSILNARGDEEIFVIEMGMSLPGEIRTLIDIAPPEIAIITKIALAHVLFFPEGIEGIAAAKFEILSHPATRMGILNYQVIPFLTAQAVRCEKRIYANKGEIKDGDFLLCREGKKFYVKERESVSPLFSLPFTASHLCEDFLGAAVVARVFGLKWTDIIAQMQKLTVFMCRFEKIEKQGIIFINDSYNANATSMIAALKNLPVPKPGKKRIAVLGAMKELGPFTESCHLEVAEVALSHIDHLLCLGEECLTMVELFKKERRPVEYFLDLDSLRCKLFELAERGDVVLLKGSKSKQLWKVLESGD